MISVEKFINVIHEQLLDPLLIMSWGFEPRYSVDVKNFKQLHEWPYSQTSPGRMSGRCIWWHEEPLSIPHLEHLQYYDVYMPNSTPAAAAEYNIAPGPPSQPGMHAFSYQVNFHLLANSEKSSLKKTFLKNWQVNDWYFFFHGFAALNWFDDYRYLKFDHYKLTKVFICLNHLITNNRSYRLNLLAHIQQHGLARFGHISAPLLTKETIKKELSDPNSRLSLNSKKNILNHLTANAEPMILDTVDYNKSSASINDDYVYSSLWNIVTETVFYDEKLHLTEKIFKPIVSKRPFILVAAPGNLAYLRSYGFKTFDRWIDESYDEVTDHDLRIFKIVEQLKILSQKPYHELVEMYHEMQAILEFNFNHFYTDFKSIIADELLNNFSVCVKQYNLGLSSRFQVNDSNINYQQIKKLLIS